MTRVARCGLCKQNFGSIQTAADHVASHKPRAKKASGKDPLWKVRYDRTGGIVEVLSGPKVGSQIERNEVELSNVGGSETDPAISGDGHVRSAWYSTPCLCSCHYGKPMCDDKKCV